MYTSTQKKLGFLGAWSKRWYKGIQNLKNTGFHRGKVGISNYYSQIKELPNNGQQTNEFY